MKGTITKIFFFLVTNNRVHGSVFDSKNHIDGSAAVVSDCRSMNIEKKSNFCKFLYKGPL